MPVFDTPDAISVDVEVGVGDIRIIASDRTDTVVDVRPSDPAKNGDVDAARKTLVEYASGRLVVKSPKGLRQFAPWAGGESVDVEIAVPSGSQVRAESSVASLRASGLLGECRCKTGVGEVNLESAGPVSVRSGAGDVTVGRITSHAEIITSSGDVRIATIDGSAVIKNSNGDTTIGIVTGDARISAGNGKITVEQARGSVVAKNGNGDIRLDEVAGGSIAAQTGFGKVSIGVLDGVAAWLDLDTGYGSVVNELDDADRPAPGEDTVEVRARSGFGDVTVRRAAASRG